jgi:hypothetical protein
VPERRYTDDEVQRILASAVESDAALTASSAAPGMTLAEVQRIAAEAGVSASSVVAAAAALDRAPVMSASSRVLGLPVGVGNTVPLPRQLDDTEWQRLVVFLRATFDAHGRVEEMAGRREWRNGNLRVSVDTVGDAAVLEMRTRKSGARSLMRTGIGLLVGSGIVEGAMLLAHGGGGMAGDALSLATTGAVLTAIGALQIPGWSSTRRKQFERVAEFARGLTAGATEPLLGA